MLVIYKKRHHQASNKFFMCLCCVRQIHTMVCYCYRSWTLSWYFLHLPLCFFFIKSVKQQVMKWHLQKQSVILFYPSFCFLFLNININTTVRLRNKRTHCLYLESRGILFILPDTTFIDGKSTIQVCCKSSIF